MTVPRERSWAIRNARTFLRSLLDPKQTPRVPRAIRKQAYWALKHFPHDHEINRVAEGYPDTFEAIESENDE